MIIEPKIRGFICTTAHPVGCEKAVEKEIQYIKKHGTFSGPKNVLVIGASTGYGLASRIAATFGAKAKTIGVSFERPADEKRTATAGWYNTVAFEKFAHREGYYAKSINGDAFSDAIKQQTADLIREEMKQVDLIIYSLASPRRTHPETGEVFSSVLKPIGSSCTSKTVDAFRGEVKEITLEPATQDEIKNTIAVMGGDDWKRWIHFLDEQKLLAPNVKTVAYSYIGPSLTFAIYRDGTIGQAKKDLYDTAKNLTNDLAHLKGHAYISINKAVVTQASAAIPVVPLYISLLFRLMKEKGTHEGCIEQIARLFRDHLYAGKETDDMIRLDDLELSPDIQQKIVELWPTITTENIEQLTDIEGYRQDFHRLFGFGFEEVNYAADVESVVG
ncbi:MAG: enoyl-ACP reductase FabV [Gammaproteobacteria bacterium]|nr:enoyl-ACP reductase FabV [Gammaproteobacteria bacterium]